MRDPVPLVIVHHANQYLVTDGYENRDGISQIARGYAEVLGLHEKYKIPFYLHLSGTLIETLAWHSPQFLDQVKALRDKNLLRLIGGTYAENIMTCFDADYNRRQILEYFRVFEKHLGGSTELDGFWVPERVWKTESLAPLIADRSWPNGGYRFVLLDRRLLFPLKSSGLTRAEIDAHGPWNPAEVSLSQLLADFSSDEKDSYLNSFQLRSLAASAGLAAPLSLLPISENLRYWIPPRTPQDFHRLRSYGQSLPPGSLLVYADDLERTAGVGGWDKTSLARYETFLQWLQDGESSLRPVHLDGMPSTSPEVSLEPGTFYELAKTFHAGEDYQGWSCSPGNQDAKNYLESSIAALQKADPAKHDSSLLDLAWKHLLASGYETYWHDDHNLGGKTSPWALALASHSRQAHVMIEAARWFQTPARPLSLETRDIDGDIQAEIILKNEHLFAVVSPQCGGRLVWLFWRSEEGGKLMIGNPTTDWNFQCELNAPMQTPPNHPGVFCDIGGEADHYELVRETLTSGLLSVTLENRSRGGLQKIFSLAEDSATLHLSLEADQVHGVTETICALSPDYLNLLRGGRSEMQIQAEPNSVIASCGRAAIELRLMDGDSAWLKMKDAVAHVARVAVSHSGSFKFSLACRKVRL